MSVGLALAERMLAARFNRGGHELDRPPHLRDRQRRRHAGGRRLRGRSLAGHLGLGRLIAFYDDNHIQLEGDTADGLLRGRRQALRGLRLARAEPGRGPRRSTRSRRRSRRPQAVADRPSLIIVRTHIGYGSPNKQDTPGGARLAARRGRGPAHQGGLRLADPDALLRARRGARALPRGRGERGARARGGVERARSTPTAREHPELPGRARRSSWTAALPDGWDADVPSFSPDDGRIATRKASQHGDPVGGRAGAAAGRRLGRPRALDADR